jgi:predicted phosphodiesterase
MKLLEYNAGMKIAIVSDTHLSTKFSVEKYNYLRDIFSQADQVILCGDFWDHDLCSFDQFINSQWQELFSVLRSRDTIYLYGDHDKQEWSDPRAELFSVMQAHSYDLTQAGRKFHIEHGDRLVPDLNILHTWTRKYKWFNRLMRILIPISTKLLGQKHYRIFYQKMNDQMLSWARTHLPPNNLLVTGHSHLPQFSPQDNFINCGANVDIMRSYLLLEDDKLTLRDQS